MTKRMFIEKMLTKQDELNRVININWKSLHYEWYRAIWTECAEVLGYTPWKWWKKGEYDSEQIKIELVDIWHFGMSSMLEKYTIERCIEILEFAWDDPQDCLNGRDMMEGIECFANKTLTFKNFDCYIFVSLCKVCGLSFEELYKLYIGKNVLNLFRQNHGYKTEDYPKLWFDKEDNYHLMSIIHNLDINSNSYEDDIYQNLVLIYNKYKETLKEKN